MSSDTAAEDLRQAFEHARDLDGSMSERLDAFADACASGTPLLRLLSISWSIV